MNKLITIALMIGFTSVYAGTNINGTVESRCTVNTDTSGYYGNPNAYTLTTLPASAGQVPVIRIDTSLANAYKAQISYPTSFSSSPSLGDTVVWTGSSSSRPDIIFRYEWISSSKHNSRWWCNENLSAKYSGCNLV